MDQATIERLVNEAIEEACTPDRVEATKIGDPPGAGFRGLNLQGRVFREFARLVEQATAEECAKLCDDMAAEGRRVNSDFRSPHVGAMGEGAAECAEQIRAKFPAAKGSA